MKDPTRPTKDASTNLDLVPAKLVRYEKSATQTGCSGAGLISLGIGAFQIVGTLLMLWVIENYLVALTEGKIDRVYLDNVRLVYWMVFGFGWLLCLAGHGLRKRARWGSTLGMWVGLIQVAGASYLFYVVQNPWPLLPLVLSVIVCVAIGIERMVVELW